MTEQAEPMASNKHTDTDSEVGFIGLGTMGKPMVRRLLAAGHRVTVWNRSPGPVEELVADGARAASDLAEVFTRPLVCSILADDTSVRERILNSGVLAGAEAAVHVRSEERSVGKECRSRWSSNH